MGWFNNLLGLNPVETRDVDTSRYTNMGNEFFDEKSKRNRGMYNSLRQMGVDSAAQQYLSGMRMQAGGQNPFANEQFRSALSSGVGQTQNAYNQYMSNAAGIGSGLYGMAMQGDMANAEAYNQAQMQSQQAKSGFYGGLFANALGALPKFLFPGAGSVDGAVKPNPKIPWYQNMDSGGLG